MGVADLGDVPNGTVSYSASSFRGVATVASLSVCAAKSPCGSSSLTVQLNLNFAFVNRARWYDYWVQDVAVVNSTLGKVTDVEDNIWNFSSAKATMESSSVKGAGAVYPYTADLSFYAYAVPTSVALTSFTLTLNASISSSGLPSVTFLYDLGAGTVAYDTVTFPFATDLAASYDFVVNGTTPNPYGLAYDAEWIVGGPGDGAGTIDLASDLDLALADWNGHNYASVADAVDYGEDTGETITDANVTEAPASGAGALAAEIVSGTETYGTLWTLATVAKVEVEGPGTCNATLSVGNGSVPYLGGNATLYLDPGTLEFGVACDGFSQSLGAVTLVAGTTTVLSFSSWATLEFVASGLPKGETWEATFGPDSVSGDSATLAAFVPLASYAYRIGSGPAGYLAAPAAGTVVVPASGITVSIDWGEVEVSATPASVDLGERVTFNVTFPSNGSASTVVWSGLPAGCPALNTSSLACEPSASGTASVTARVTDASGDEATSPSLRFAVATDPSVTTPTAGPASIDANQTVTFSTTETGGVAAFGYVWSGLPAGCPTVDSTSVTCRPTAPGLLSVSVEVEDGNLATNQSPALAYTVVPDPSVASFSATPTSGAPGTSFLLDVAVVGGVGPYSYSYLGLPLNCSGENLSTISCRTGSVGTYVVEVEVVDANGMAANRTLTFTVRASGPGPAHLDPYLLAAIVGGVVAAGVAVTAGLLWRRRPGRGA